MGLRCTEKCDLFSFGVVLWEVVTGETPQRGRLRSIRWEEPGMCLPRLPSCCGGCMWCSDMSFAGCNEHDQRAASQCCSVPEPNPNPRCRVPEECPQAVADLVAQCMDADPAARPSAKEVVSLLSQPDAVLERHLPSRRPRPSDAQARHSFEAVAAAPASLLPSRDAKPHLERCVVSRRTAEEPGSNVPERP
jgi:serine/threonine protein kinase